MVKVCPICQSSFPTKVALANHMATHARRGARRGGRRNGGGGAGVNTISLKEYWGSSTRGVTTIDCKPTSSTLPKLAAIASVYELYKLESFTVHFVHNAGANVSGSVVAGVSFGQKHPEDKKGVASLSPAVCKAASSDFTLSVPCARLMGQPWLETANSSPGCVLLSIDGNSITYDIWVTYRVKLSGPTNVAQTYVLDETYSTDGAEWFDAEKRKVTRATFSEDVYGEIEYAGDSSNFGRFVTAFQNLFSGWRELHRLYQTSVGLVHFLSSAGTYVLPAVGVPAILHVQRRPFRASKSDWERLRRGQAPPDAGGAAPTRELVSCSSKSGARDPEPDPSGSGH